MSESIQQYFRHDLKFKVEGPPRKELIQAVTICFFFSEHLKYCLNNRFLFDRWLIVTTESDKDTIALCKKFSIEYCFTDRLKHKGAVFAKGRAINDGITRLSREGWIILLDCDIILPNNLREQIQKIRLSRHNKATLYSLRGRRTLCAPQDYISTTNYSNYKKFHNAYRKKVNRLQILDRKKIDFYDKEFIKLRHKFNINKKAGLLRKQWIDFEEGRWQKLGYTFEGPEQEFLGYFQMFHSSHVEKYPELSFDANNDDVKFRDSFPKKRRKVINLDCVHIGLPNRGNLFSSLLDSVLSTVNTKGPCSYLRLLKSKPKTLTVNPVQAPTPTRKMAFFPNPRWRILNGSKLRYQAAVEEPGKQTFLVHEFLNRKNADWYACALVDPKPIPLSRYKQVCFLIRVEKLDGDLAVGYSSGNVYKWVNINVANLKDNHWYKCNLDFIISSDFEKIDTPLIFRVTNPEQTGKISLTNIFYVRR